MALSDFSFVVLAAGKGTRLRSSLAKVLHVAAGRTLLEHVIRSCKALKPRAIVAVVGHQADAVAAVAQPLGARIAVQSPQRGTGDAVLVARRVLGPRAKLAVVVPGDAPLIRPETLAALARLHQSGGAAATILSAELADPTGYGRIVRRDDGTVAAIVEDSALTDEQRAIREINSSMYAFTLDKLWPCLQRLRPNGAHQELYLTDAIAALRAQEETVRAEIVADADEVLGCNTRADLARVDAIFRRRKRDSLMASGVGMQMPETILIDADVTVGPDTLLGPGVQLVGKTRVGANCTIGAGSVLSDMTLEDGVVVKPYCVANTSHLSAGAEIGPFSHLRGDVRLMKQARLGNFVEAKKSVLGVRVKAMHLSYLGDARIGEETNIGAGTITCNYDGLQKNPTTIGRRVFVGSDTALVAPVRVADGAYIAAGSVITDNVPADALAIARGKQVNKPGWAAARRREMAAAKPSVPRRNSRPRKSSAAKRTKRRAAPVRRAGRLTARTAARKAVRLAQKRKSRRR